MLFHKTKRIVIAGCGPLGASLANTLYKKGHKVVVLDQNQESFRFLPEEFGGYEMEGDPTDSGALKRAGIEDAGIFIAATQDDNTNLLAAQIASRIFHVKQVYARLDDASRHQLVSGLPIKPISLYSLSADDYAQLAETVSREAAV